MNVWSWYIPGPVLMGIISTKTWRLREKYLTATLHYGPASVCSCDPPLGRVFAATSDLRCYCPLRVRYRQQIYPTRWIQPKVRARYDFVSSTLVLTKIIWLSTVLVNGEFEGPLISAQKGDSLSVSGQIRHTMSISHHLIYRLNLIISCTTQQCREAPRLWVILRINNVFWS